MNAALARSAYPRDGAAGSRASAIEPSRRLDRVIAFALGLSLQFNVITSTFGLPFMRLSDLLPFAVIPYFCLRTNFLSQAVEQSVRIGLVFVLLIASVLLKTEQGPGDVYMTLILMVYFVQALQILMVFGQGLTTALSAGILAGYVGSLAVLIAAGAGWDLEAFGLAMPTDGMSAEQVLFMQDKIGGLWAAGNQTGHIFAAAGAAAYYLTKRFKSNVFYLSYFAGMLISFPVTNNRAGLIVPFIALIFVTRAKIRPWHVLFAGSAIGLAALYAGVSGIVPLPDALSDTLESRLSSDSDLDRNISERLATGFEAVAMMVRHPFGIGNIALENELQLLTGVGTPHNGIIALGLQSGLLVAALYVAGLVQILIGKSKEYGYFMYFTVVFSTLSMFFEQLTATQYFLFLVALVLAAWATNDRRRQTPVPLPENAFEKVGIPPR